MAGRKNLPRNLCDWCASCEERNTFRIKDCIDLCGAPMDILEAVEKERKKQEQEQGR